MTLASWSAPTPGRKENCSALLLFVLTACGTERLSSVNVEVFVAESRLDYGAAIPGHAIERSLTLTAQRQISVTLDDSPPFAHAPSIELEAGTTVLPVTFTAPAVGDFEQVLRVAGQAVIFVGSIRPTRAPSPHRPGWSRPAVTGEASTSTPTAKTAPSSPSARRLSPSSSSAGPESSAAATG